MANYNNFANSISFFAQFSYEDQTLKYFIQGVKLPDISNGIIDFRKKGKQLTIPGDSLDHGTIPVSFILDEKFDVYFTLLELQEKYNSDQTSIDLFEIYIQDNQHINIAKFVFEDVFFVNVQGPDLRTDTNETEMKIDVELAFKKWTRQKLAGA